MNPCASCEEAFGALEAGAALLGIEMSNLVRERIIRFCDLLLDTNRVTNLTAIRTPEGVMQNLILDAFTLVDMIPPERRGPGTRVVDVGAGAGFPGIPLKILFPGWHLTLIESVGKKARFLEQACEHLGLKDVSVLNTRAEQAGLDPKFRDRADLAVARAVAALPTLLELCAPLVGTGGLLIFPKSRDVESEVGTAAAAEDTLGVRLQQVWPVPGDLHLGDDHVLIVYEKVGKTPPGYPRRVGLARARPITSR